MNYVVLLGSHGDANMEADRAGALDVDFGFYLFGAEIRPTNQVEGFRFFSRCHVANVYSHVTPVNSKI